VAAPSACVWLTGPAIVLRIGRPKTLNILLVCSNPFLQPAGVPQSLHLELAWRKAVQSTLKHLERLLALVLVRAPRAKVSVQIQRRQPSQLSEGFGKRDRNAQWHRTHTQSRYPQAAYGERRSLGDRVFLLYKLQSSSTTVIPCVVCTQFPPLLLPSRSARSDTTSQL